MKKRIKMSLTLYGSTLLGFLCIAVFSSLILGEENTHTIESIYLDQKVYAVPLNRSFSFSGESVPDDNFDIKERLDREILVNAYSHATTLMNIKHSKRYFPIFERILSAYGVPDDFKYLAVAESNFRLGTSSAGAKGLWQFMAATAKGYGLEISDDVDERLHVEKSTEAACRLLLDYKKRFGSWMLAATAYNFGETRMARELNAQKSDNFFDLQLNAETSRYLFRVIAIKEVMSNPQAYGYILNESDYYQPLKDYKLVEVNSSIPSLSQFAQDHKISYRMLKLYNPWLINDKLTVKPGKSYQIKIPV